MKVEKSNVQDVWPLRPLQEGMLFHYLQGGEEGQYMERLVLTIQGRVEDVLFEESWRSVFQYNDVLRSIFKWEDLKKPVQLVLHKLDPALDIYDFTAWIAPKDRRQKWKSPEAFRRTFGQKSAEALEGVQGVDELVNQVEREMKAREKISLLDLKKGAIRISLCKFHNECRMFITYHHILLDGWSLGIILEEWLTVYRTLSEGHTPAKPEKTGFKRYLSEIKKNRNGEQEAKFWSDYLIDYEIKQNIQPFYPPQKQRFKQLSKTLPVEYTALIRNFCAECGMTAATFLYGVWGILLQRFKHAEDIIFGTTVSGRSVNVERIDTIAGLLINTVPLRIQSRNGESTKAFFLRVHDELGRRRPHELTGLTDIKSYGGFKGPEELFDTLVVMENYPLGRVLFETPMSGGHPQTSLHIGSYQMEEHTHYPLTLLIRESESYELEFIYDTTAYEYFVVKQMSECFEQLLNNIARDPEQELSTVQMAQLSDLDMNTYLNNSTIREYPTDRTIAQCFADSMSDLSEHTAIIHENGAMTYRELDELSDRIATELICMGAGTEQCIGILSQRSPEMIAGLLAILKAGAAYVPVHPDYPQERKRFIIEDSGLSLLLTENETDSSLFASMGVKTISLKGNWPLVSGTEERGYIHPPAGERLACIVYTSGSTGRPKGIMIEQRGIVRLVKHTEFVDFRRSDVILPTCPLEFDVSNFEIWGALLNGSALCLISPDKLLMPQALKETLREQKVSLMWMTTPLFNQMAKSDPSLFATLRYLIVGGDALSPVYVNKVRQACPGLTMVNGYGPSENSVLSTTHRIERNYDVRVPIGKPISNSTAYIIDQYGKFLPAGAVGELCVGLDGVARGYLNNPELTHEKFITDPAYPHYKMFKTGDLARWLPDGSIDFLGRADYQVKVRGYRLELQEIENELYQLEQIDACAVLILTEPDKEKELAAYIVSGRKWSVAEVRHALLERLPSYAVPTRIVQLDGLPLTVNGKIDKKALLRIPLQPIESAESSPSPVSMERIVLDIWKESLGVNRIGLDDNFFDIGGNSLLTVQISDKIQKLIGFELSVTDLFRYPTIRELAGYLSNWQKSSSVYPSVATKEHAEVETGGTADIAVVGMAARFPGAADIGQFWSNLQEGKESISFFSEEELREMGLDESTLRHPDYVKAKGVLDDIEYFDAGLFEYSAHDAELMDPQIRILHECAWACLENASYDPDQYDGSVGLFVGASVNLHWVNHLFNTLEDDTDRWRAANLNVHSLSMPVSYKLNLKGPSITVETACSSSLVGVHLACKSLLERECGMALAGGVSVTVPKKSGYLYQDGMIKSPDGHCRAFDAEAKGTVSGDGAGLVALKRFEDALADGDHIYAVIKGSAINNDGSRKVGFTAPSVEGQIEVMVAAQRAGAIPPESISYIEAHGTATPLGDPIEIEALSEIFPATSRTSTAIGSVKTNVGHLDTAAGIAGLIKTVLSLYHKQLPPSLNFKHPNPKIRFDKTSLYVNAILKDWEPPAGYPRRAGVSSFGIGGTNAHVVLEEPPATALPKTGDERTPGVASPQLFLLSAATELALSRRVSDLLSYLDKVQDEELPAIAHSLRVGRKGLACRFAVIATTKEELARRLDEYQNEPLGSVRMENPKNVVFLFPGQGSQYVEMAKDLYSTEPFFRRQIDRCLEIASPLLQRDLKQIWFPLTMEEIIPKLEEAEEGTIHPIDLTETAQPLLFMVEYATAQLLIRWGISPAAMIGHSLGEYTAACLSGVMSLEDALQLIIRRSTLMQRMERGGMVNVYMSQEKLLPLISEWPDLSIAATNSSEMTVISGPEASIRSFSESLTQLGHDGIRLKVSHAFHSVMMEPMLTEYRDALCSISLSAPSTPYVSNVTGEFITAELAIDPEYYVSHVRQSVRFKEGIVALTRHLDPLFIEVGPGQTLSQLIRANAAVSKSVPVLHTLPRAKEKRTALHSMLQALADLWMNGVPIDWNAYNEHRQGQRVPLPVYPFEKEYYWKFREMYEPKSQKVPAANSKSPLSEWFYVPEWHETNLDATQEEVREVSHSRTVLLLANRTPLADRLAKALPQQGDRCITVYPGEDFERISDTTFTIDPGNALHYTELYVALTKDGVGAPDQVIHLWGVGKGAENEGRKGSNMECILVRCLYSVMYLVQAAGTIASMQKLDLTLMASGMEMLNDGDRTDPLKSTLKGAAGVIPLEYPNISVRTLDVKEIEDGDNLSLVLKLLRSEKEKKPISTRYAFRHNRCYEHCFVKTNIASSNSSELKRHGVYLITGGLGGIGLALAEHLAERYQAKLVLVGRTPRQAEQQLERMRAAGTEVMIEYADVSDVDAMERVVNVTMSRYGPIDGVFHAAGVPDAAMIHSTTKEQISMVLQPKLGGTEALYKVLSQLQPQPSFLVLFSSISGIFGAFGQAGYAAANTFLDGFAQNHACDKNGMRILSIDWDTWNEVGMAVESVKRYNNRGNLAEALPVLPLRIEHPLLTSRSDTLWTTPFLKLPEGASLRTYISRLSAEKHWVLDEHRMLGTPVLPGTAYLELIRACFEDLNGEASVTIQELFFLQPLSVEEECEVRTVWVDRGICWEFTIVTEGTNGSWTEHAKGSATREQAVPTGRLTAAELEVIRSQLDAAGHADESEQDHEDMLRMQYGSRWNSVNRVYRRGSEGIAEISLDDRYREDLKDYRLHPSLLDRATSFMDDQGSSDAVSYLPFAYKNAVIRKPMTAEIYSLVQTRGEKSTENLTFSCQVVDLLGNVLIDIGEFVMKRVHEQSSLAQIPVDVIARTPVIGNYKLEISEPGEIDTLHFKQTTRRKPGRNEVEIRVSTNGVNFKEVLYALGILKLPESHSFGFGLECSGTVVSVGSEVTDLHPGDEVIALADASFGKYALAPAGSVVQKPANLSFQEAATLPISYMTAYYALVKRGQLAPGEKVLIHSATGGVGMAAIQIAKWIGAEIYATAGSVEKRDYLRSIGINHVYPSRTLEFAEQIRETAGSVDVVLNSLTGKAIESGISLLAPHGRFLEMGVKDIMENSQLGMKAFEQGVSFTGINIGSHIPGFTALFREIAGHVEAGHFKPLPLVSYRLEETKQAYQYMASARHIGKIVITHYDIEQQSRADDRSAELLNGMTNAEGLEVLERVLAYSSRTGQADPVQFLISTTDLEERLLALESGSMAGVTAAPTSATAVRTRKRPTISTEYYLPLTETEKQLAQLIANFLGLEKVGLHDNFFEVGATSLDMVQINTKVNMLFGKDPSIVKMYSYPTVCLLNRYLIEEINGDDGGKEAEERKRKESRLKTLQSIKGVK